VTHGVNPLGPNVVRNAAQAFVAHTLARACEGERERAPRCGISVLMGEAHIWARTPLERQRAEAVN
jgi:hypothetical protein